MVGEKKAPVASEFPDIPLPIHLGFDDQADRAAWAVAAQRFIQILVTQLWFVAIDNLHGIPLLRFESNLICFDSFCQLKKPGSRIDTGLQGESAAIRESLLGIMLDA